MLADLRALIDADIADEPLRRLTRTLVDRHAERLKALPATPRNFYPFAGGWLEHTLSVARTPPGWPTATASATRTCGRR